MIPAPNLFRIPGLAHGFFTREGGVSEGAFASLNGGWASGDALEAILENRRTIMARLGMENLPLLSLRQVHGNAVVTVTAPWDRDAMPEADAMVTRIPGIAIGILTADCAPVLLVDPAARIIGAAHAGWKGALGGVIEATVEAMCALGAERPAIRAAVGPCIGFASYEVDAAFHSRFTEQDATHARFFAQGSDPAHYQFDLRGFVSHRLAASGVVNVNTDRSDTYRDTTRFYSFRRMTHEGGTQYGRQLSVIGWR
jgi:YfiH family protein